MVYEKYQHYVRVEETFYKRRIIQKTCSGKRRKITGINVLEIIR